MTRLMLVMGMTAALPACAGEPEGAADPDATPPPRFEASAWPEADALFRGDERWRGADGAWSVDLGEGRTLWLFGDTIIDPQGRGSRRGAEITMVSNTLAIQRGDNPEHASVRYFWSTREDGSPGAFFPDEEGVRHWPGHAAMLEGALLIFLVRVRDADTDLGFEAFDWSAALVHNPEEDPDAWNITRVDGPKSGMQVIVGASGVIVEDGFLYAFSSLEPGTGRIFLARVPADDAAEGDLSRIRWWSERCGWVAPEQAEASATPVFTHLGTACTVHFDERSGRYINLRTLGFGEADVVMRTAPALTGPWSSDTLLYAPPEKSKPDIWIYQGKAHPHLTGADLVATYCTNSFEFADLFSDEDLYYPRFLRLRRVEGRLEGGVKE